MALELDSLIRSVESLKRAISAADKSQDIMNPDLREAVKAGIIQNFETAYEQCWKFIQRWLRQNQAPEEANYPRTRKELFRMAARAGIISNPTPWFEFGEARNLTSHTYNAAQAKAAHDAARRFLPYAEELLKNLTERND